MYILKCKIFAENHWFLMIDLALKLSSMDFHFQTWKYVLQFVEIDKPLATYLSCHIMQFRSNYLINSIINNNK